MNEASNGKQGLRNTIADVITRIVCCFIPSRQKRKFMREWLPARLVQPKKRHMPSRYMSDLSPVTPFARQASNEWHEYFLAHEGHDLNKWHHYFSIYHKHFSRFKNKPVRILEIGVFKGGSLKMWKSFFGEQAEIFGVDIDENCKTFNDPNKKIHVFIGDQSDPRFLRELMARLPKIDIVIDDGGHTTLQQITTFLECYDKIADDGVYLCEDLHTNYWPSFIDSSETFVDFAKRHVDYLNAYFFEGVGKKDYSTRDVMPVFTNITHSVTFYRSIIVFEKEKVEFPVSELR